MEEEDCLDAATVDPVAAENDVDPSDAAAAAAAAAPSPLLFWPVSCMAFTFSDTSRRVGREPGASAQHLQTRVPHVHTRVVTVGSIVG